MGKQTKKKKSTGAAKEIFAKPPGRLGKWNAIAFVSACCGRAYILLCGNTGDQYTEYKFLGMDGHFSCACWLLYA